MLCISFGSFFCMPEMGKSSIFVTAKQHIITICSQVSIRNNPCVSLLIQYYSSLFTIRQLSVFFLSQQGRSLVNKVSPWSTRSLASKQVQQLPWTASSSSVRSPLYKCTYVQSKVVSLYFKEPSPSSQFLLSQTELCAT